ncbi:MAG: hypothetical protein ACLFUJ_12830 [Phycisphaerae bacterium]
MNRKTTRETSETNPAGEEPLRRTLSPLAGPLWEQKRLLGATVLAGWAKLLTPVGIPLLLQVVMDRILRGDAPAARRAEMLQFWALIALGVVALNERTVLVIAHRLSTVRNVDEIIVIEDGQIAEAGTYDQLLARDGLFSSLVSEQELVGS